MSDVKKDIKKLFFDNTVVVLSAFLGLFLAYIVQACYNVFSYSAEASSIVVNYNATEYYGYADSWINQGINYTNANMWLIMFSLILYAIFVGAFFVSIEYIRKTSRPKLMKIMLSIVLITVIASWFVEPLIVIFSSTTNPTLVYRISPGAIPNSDAARVSYLFSELDRFELFSMSFNFSFRNLVLATSVLIAGLSLTQLGNVLNLEHLDIRKKLHVLSKSSIIRKSLFITALLILAILPIIVYYFSAYPFSYAYYVGGQPSSNYRGTLGSLYIDGIGAVYLGEMLHIAILNDILMNSFKVFLILWIGLILASCILFIRKGSSEEREKLILSNIS